MKVVTRKGQGHNKTAAGTAEHALPASLAAPARPPGRADLTTAPPGGPRPEAERPGPTPAAQISQVAAGVARLTPRVGLPDAEALAASDATLVIDPYARAIAVTYERALPPASGVIDGAADMAAALGRGKAQLAAAVRLYAAVVQLSGAAAGTRRLYAVAVLRFVRQLVRRVRLLLDDDRVPRREREKLRSDAAELLEIDDRLRAVRGATAKTTKKRKAEVEEQVGEVQRQKELFHTLLSMHRGQAVPPAEAAAAAATYEALTGTAEAAAPTPARDKRRRTP
jgi:hypothetical protein